MIAGTDFADFLREQAGSWSLFASRRRRIRWLARGRGTGHCSTIVFHTSRRTALFGSVIMGKVTALADMASGAKYFQLVMVTKAGADGSRDR